jgi:hypothetical protein
MADQRKILSVWDDYITVLYDRTNGPGNLKVETEKVDEDEKGPYILHGELEKSIKKMRNKKAAGDHDALGDVLKIFGKDDFRLMKN